MLFERGCFRNETAPFFFFLANVYIFFGDAMSFVKGFILGSIVTYSAFSTLVNVCLITQHRGTKQAIENFRSKPYREYARS